MSMLHCLPPLLYFHAVPGCYFVFDFFATALLYVPDTAALVSPYIYRPVRLINVRKMF